MIELKDITKIYKKGQSAVSALSGISLLAYNQL